MVCKYRDSPPLEKIINDTAKDFGNGETAKGWAKIVLSTLNALIGQSSATMKEERL